MDKRDLEKHIQWQASKKNYHKKNILVIRQKESYQEHFVNFGILLQVDRNNSLLKQASLKYIMNKYMIY